MEIKKDPLLFALAAVVLVGVGVLIYTGKVTWEIGAAFVGLYILPSIFGRKQDAAKLLVLAAFAVTTSCAASKAEVAKQTYREEALDCVDRYELETEIRDCVRRVKARWGVDGGADGSR